jgi:proline racemase
MVTLNTIDAHAEGGPLRLIVGGFPAPRGRTMHEKVEWVKRHADGLRRALMLEPRGHAGMCGAILTEPVSPGAHAGVIFMSGGGYAPMSGHGIIAVTVIALERRLLTLQDDGQSVVYDTPAGTVRAVKDGPRVTFQGVPSFVTHGGLVVAVGGRQVRVDVAFGGAFYAIADSEALGLPVDAAHALELRRAGAEVKRAVDAAGRVQHPLDPRLEGIFGTILTGPPRDEGADLRSVMVSGAGLLDRSPSGTGTAAIIAVLDAMGLMREEQPFVHEGPLGTRLTGRLTRRTTVADREAIVADVSGSAWVTGEHVFLVDDGDPLGGGFSV